MTSRRTHCDVAEACRPCVVIPAHNEASSVAEAILEIRSYCNYPIYLVDDASTDGTGDVAQEAGAIVIPLVNQLGAWGATQAGIRYAIRQQRNLVIAMDADGQHDPAYFDSLMAPLATGNADVCIGSYAQRGSKMRKLAWLMLRNISGIGIEDLTSGFRAYNHRAIVELASWRATFLDFQDVGVLALLIKSGMAVVDTETEMRARKDGHSRIFRSWLVVSYYMFHSLLLGLTKRPIRRFSADKGAQPVRHD